METKHKLEDRTITGLQELVEITEDSRRGAIEAANAVDNIAFRKLFLRLAEQRMKAKAQLGALLQLNDAHQFTSGSAMGQIHRWWMTLRTACSSDKIITVLKEAERGEQAIADKYMEVIKRCSSSAANDVLHKHVRQIQQTLVQLRELRETIGEAEYSKSA